MIDERLERRLRSDTLADPIHLAGRVRDRTVEAVVVRVRPRQSTIGLRPLGLLLAIAISITIGAVIIIKPMLTGPAAAPSPTRTPGATFTTRALEAVVQQWLGGVGPPDSAPISVTLIGPTGTSVSYTDGALPGDPPFESSARIGEASRVYIAAALALIDDCSQVNAEFSCRKGVYPTTMRIDDAINRWYPDWPADDPTTIRMLLQGQSGLAPAATDLADLSAQIAANPGAGWSRAAVLARAISAPRRFSILERVDAADTEWLLLEAIVERATGKTSSQVIPTEAFALPFDTTTADQRPVALMTGRTSTGSTISDLAPAVMALVGNAGGMAAPSADLAEYAISAWTPGELLNPSIVTLLTDGTHGHALPLGAVSTCPCQLEDRLVIKQVGRAVGWSTIVAYDYATQTAVGVALGRDAQPSDLDALLQALLQIPLP